MANNPALNRFECVACSLVSNESDLDNGKCPRCRSRVQPTHLASKTESLRRYRHTSAYMLNDEAGPWVSWHDANSEIERWKEQAFRPLGDNHHNANACPHCRGQSETTTPLKHVDTKAPHPEGNDPACLNCGLPRSQHLLAWSRGGMFDPRCPVECPSVQKSDADPYSDLPVETT